MDMEGLVGQKAAVFVRKGRAFWPFWSILKTSKTRILSRIAKKRIASCCTENPKQNERRRNFGANKKGQKTGLSKTYTTRNIVLPRFLTFFPLEFNLRDFYPQ